IPHYLEMAADNAGRAATSTPVLASALLKIGEKSGQAARPACGSVALHAAGTDRIRHLIAPPAGVQGIAPVSGMLGIAAVLLTTNVLVQLPYFKAMLDGCLFKSINHLPGGVTAKLTASKDKGWYPHHHGGHRQYGTGQGRGSVTKPCGNHRTTNGGPGSVGQTKCRVV